MSLYMRLWYQGILKPEFRAPMQQMFTAQRWELPGTPLGELLEAAFAGFVPVFRNADANDPEGAPEIWRSPEYGLAPSFDPETGLLRYYAEWNQHGSFYIAMRNLEDRILPMMTQELISWHGWVEPMDDEVHNPIADLTEHCCRKIPAVQKELEALTHEELMNTLF